MKWKENPKGIYTTQWLRKTTEKGGNETLEKLANNEKNMKQNGISKMQQQQFGTMYTCSNDERRTTEKHLR